MVMFENGVKEKEMKPNFRHPTWVGPNFTRKSVGIGK